MSYELLAVSAHARSTPAEDRARFAEQLGRISPTQTVVLGTCHRVEAFGERGRLEAMLEGNLPPGAMSNAGIEAARHVMRLAVGLESAVVAEDQILHQMREALRAARSRGPLPPPLDRLFDVCLRAGRRARTWLPARRRGLAELALERVLPDGAAPTAATLVVGAGEMGRRAGRAVIARGGSLLATSRTPERAVALATELRARPVAFDPGPRLLAEVGGVIVALTGEWHLAAPSQAALAADGAWVIDLSAPSALPSGLSEALGQRLVGIDELAAPSEDSRLSEPMLARLEQLVEDSVAEYTQWVERDTQRNLARALAEKASEAQTAELIALWQRAPDLPEAHRTEVERMARHLAERLLRDPLEQLEQDGDGRHVRAARELFRL